MSLMDTGLRHRLRRARKQIESQHEQLRTLHDALCTCCANARVDAVRAAADRLAAAIDAHFSMEDEVFFPALHGLHRESESDLKALIGEHARYRKQFAELCEGLRSDSIDDFEKSYRALAAAMAEHEGREERLVASLIGAIDPS